jgi:hypothetical protein
MKLQEDDYLRKAAGIIEQSKYLIALTGAANSQEGNVPTFRGENGYGGSTMRSNLSGSAGDIFHRMSSLFQTRRLYEPIFRARAALLLASRASIGLSNLSKAPAILSSISAGKSPMFSNLMYKLRACCRLPLRSMHIAR